MVDNCRSPQEMGKRNFFATLGAVEEGISYSNNTMYNPINARLRGEALKGRFGLITHQIRPRMPQRRPQRSET